MTADATTAAPRVAARRFSESLHVLVDPDLRAFILGLAAVEADGRYRPKEGETIRSILDQAAARLFLDDPKQYGKIIKAGRAEMAARVHRAR